MRATRSLNLLSRGFSANPRIFVRQQGAQLYSPSKAFRLNSSSPESRTEQKAQDSNTGSSTGNSSSWNTGQILLISTLAAGIGYGLAASRSAHNKEPGVPQYGTAKDFEKVEFFFFYQWELG
ncbi:hypothetical protein BJY01DRAFT_51276 [Aspergillus pseudoustus]|uniref:Uncharacterized protein n=1 Tax=Aspergillus pseudoustus TaxID=1810923 RepID=A0ABR4KRR3_9EURO